MMTTVLLDERQVVQQLACASRSRAPLDRGMSSSCVCVVVMYICMQLRVRMYDNLCHDRADLRELVRTVAHCSAITSPSRSMMRLVACVHMCMTFVCMYVCIYVCMYIDEHMHLHTALRLARAVFAKALLEATRSFVTACGSVRVCNDVMTMSSIINDD